MKKETVMSYDTWNITVNESNKEVDEEKEEKGEPTYNTKFVSWFTGTSMCDVKHPEFGKHQLTPMQVQFSKAEYKNKIFKCIDKAVKDGKITEADIKKHSKK
jgi:hypothetical protein